MLLLLLAIISAIIVAQCDQKHTPAYIEHGTSNDEYFYFDPATKSPGTNTELYSTNDKFKTVIKRNIRCTGKWCNGDWSCLPKGITCYEVEHIIATASKIPAISDCDRNVRGNLIMSYSSWNHQLQETHLNEKVEIYGSDIVKTAYDSIYLLCKKSLPTSYSPELCLGVQPPSNAAPSAPTAYSNDIYSMWFITGIGLIIVFAIVAYFIFVKQKPAPGPLSTDVEMSIRDSLKSTTI